MKPSDSGEDYELTPSNLDGQESAEPLLPRYERHDKPVAVRTYERRRSSFRKALSCILFSLIVIVPSFAFMTCYFGRVTLDKVRSWDQLPPEWKQWLDQYGPSQSADHGNFPTNIGYAGPTPTGSEAALLATAPALPLFTGVAPLVPPDTKSRHRGNIMQSWGNLSPYHSVESHGLPESSSLIPEGCQLDELHWLQRHGARYPTIQADGPAGIAARLKAGTWTAKGKLAFLNDWEYKLGAEVLTPFGRQQLFNLGVAARLKYGFLLDKMKGRLPVFRTETQDRMLKSAQNFAAGFFGYPAEDSYNLEVMIESPGFNCTLAPWNACKIKNDTSYSTAFAEMAKWDEIFLARAQRRLQDDIEGYDLSIRDVKDLMEMCAYETVALGYSAFCNLFTAKEWSGFEYRNDIYWWYTGSFGYPQARAQGKGWAQELLSRLKHHRLTTFDSTTNSSFHNDVHFPLRDSLYVDFTHDTQFALLLPTLNLTSFAESGAPPTDQIPKHWSFQSSKFCPFATNLQVQVLTCPAKESSKQVRIILNDAPVPLTGINGCVEDEEGLCAFDSFVDSVQQLVDEVDFSEVCDGGSAAEGQFGPEPETVAEEIEAEVEPAGSEADVEETQADAEA